MILSPDYTIAVLKPDGVQQNLEPEILQIFAENRLEVLATTRRVPDRAFALAHLYGDSAHKERTGRKIMALFAANGLSPEGTTYAAMTPYQAGDHAQKKIIASMVGQTHHAYVLHGENALERLRALCGATFPADAQPDTIRGRFGHDSFACIVREDRAPRNIIHSADSPEEARRQISLWFPDWKP